MHLFTLFSLLPLASADFLISSPAAGVTISADKGLTLEFSDDGNTPTFAQIADTKVLLCTGSNADIDCLATVGTLAPATYTTAKTSIAIALAPYLALASNGPYYLQLYSTSTLGGFSIQYSQRFALTGMTGTLQATDGGDVAPPDAQVDVAGAGAAGAAAGLSLGTVPYTLQTGKTRYAPMQTQPGTKVTYKLSASRRFPTSQVTLFTDYTMQPLQKTTITPSWSYTVVQGPNWAATAASPSGYYAASEALARNINAKSRRGYYEL